MKTIYAFIISSFTLLSCDFESEGILRNKSTNTLIFKVKGGNIDGFYKNAILDSKNNNQYTYILESNTYERLFFAFNDEVTANKISFDELEIISEEDTTVFIGKESIFQQFKKKSKSTYEFVIE